ncbi:MAG TPA: hypothetical protein PLT04_01210 [Candidatus Saccharibacteria bacterium]|nr:hypothetical protein [Candidatus Saccharibacteria bacterium]
MNIKRTMLGRATALLSAFAIAVGAVVPLLAQSHVGAAQLQWREIKMSDSRPSATGVTYHVEFDAIGAAQELVVEFCADTPLIGASCDTTAAGIPTLTGATSSLGTPAVTGNLVKITGLTVTGSNYSVDLGGISNPSNLGSFYARLLTFTTGGSAAYSGGSDADYVTAVDYGGLALSTVQQVTITARVMETLTFCVSGDKIDGSVVGVDNCADATTPTVDIGTGTPRVLSASAVDRDSAWMQLSTNATHGAIVRMKATNTCAEAGLSSTGGAACSIPGINGGGNGSAAAAIVAGTAGFGLFVDHGTATTGATNSTSGKVFGDVNYHSSTPANANIADPANLHYGMDRQSGTGAQGVLTVYGDPIAASSGPVSQENNELVFAATSSLTTPAGIYTGNEILIATGTF